MAPKKIELNQTFLDDFNELRADVKSLLQRVAVLEVKAGMWGALGGALVLICSYLKNQIFK